MTPPSPRHGSTNTAAQSASTAAASASASPNGTNLAVTPNGPNGSRIEALPVIASDPMVRPWNPPSAATITGRDGPWRRRTSLSAASLASVPVLAKNTRPSARLPRRQPLGEGDLALVQEQVRAVRQGTCLARHGLGQGRVTVAERADRDAGDEVQVPAAVRVPDEAALAPGQRDGRDAIGGHQRAGVALLQCGARAACGAGLACGTGLACGSGHRAPPSGSTMVPTPVSVKISSRIACGSRPSSTCACGTPPVTAVRQARILGIMPSLRRGSIAASSAAVSWLITGSAGRGGQSRYSPGTSVSRTSLAAPRATASAAAALSAFTL